MDQKEFNDLRNTTEQLFKELKTEAAEIKKFGHALPETVEKIEKMQTRLDDLETKMNRSPISTEAKTEEVSPLTAAFVKSLRFHRDPARDAMSDEEKSAWREYKSLYSSSDIQGGLLVPEDFRAEIIKRQPNYANVGSLVRSIDTSRDTVRYPRLTHNISDSQGTLFGSTDIVTSAIGVTWEDETETVTSTDFTLGQVEIPTHKMRSLVKTSRELLEDSVLNVVNFLSDLFAERTAVELDRVFTKGSGGKQPEGFMTSSLIPTVASGSGGSNTITYDGIVDTWAALPSQYAANAVWMCRRSTLGLLRKLKDAVGQPLWQPSMIAGEPSTMLGHPVRLNEHIPAAGVAGAAALLFANFNMLYLAVRKTGMTMQRLDEKYAETDEVAFIVRERVGGKVVGEWAGRYNIMS
jgi:HK97 family phage major capsid protein